MTELCHPTRIPNTHLEKTTEVVVFADGTRITCPSKWAKDLASEVEEKFKGQNPPQKSRQQYAGGILKNWRKDGEASGTALFRNSKAAAAATAAVQAEVRKVESELRALEEAKKALGHP